MLFPNQIKKKYRLSLFCDFLVEGCYHTALDAIFQKNISILWLCLQMELPSCCYLHFVTPASVRHPHLSLFTGEWFLPLYSTVFHGKSTSSTTWNTRSQPCLFQGQTQSAKFKPFFISPFFPGPHYTIYDMGISVSGYLYFSKRPFIFFFGWEVGNFLEFSYVAINFITLCLCV